jgi:hypothetical protein
MLYLNNVYPWRGQDNCLTDSWYLANDIWFIAIGLNLIDKYLKNKKLFLIQIAGLMSLFMLIQVVQILSNDFSASYFTFNDEYWTLYFKKPFPHFHAFAIGMVLGCFYFSYKY